MRYGYARVSTADQDLSLQLDALNHAHCEQIVTDTITGSRINRPGLNSLLPKLASGDELVVWKIDRLARNSLELLTFVQGLSGREVCVCSLTEGIDSSKPSGKMMITLLGAIAEMERSTIRERVLAGMAAAKRAGVHCGRKPVLGHHQIEAMKQLRESGYSQHQAARALGVCRATVQRREREQIMIAGIPIESF